MFIESVNSMPDSAYVEDFDENEEGFVSETSRIETSDSSSYPGAAYRRFRSEAALAQIAPLGIPNEVLDRAKARLLEYLRKSFPQIDPNQVILKSFKPVTWNDGSLGCPEPGMNYTQALVPGYEIEFQVGKTTFVLHTDGTGSLVVSPDFRKGGLSHINGPISLPAHPNFDWPTMTFSDFSFPETVRPGQKFTVTVSYKLDRDAGTNAYFYGMYLAFGIAGESAQNLSRYPADQLHRGRYEGRFSFEMTAPKTPGLYEIRIQPSYYGSDLFYDQPWWGLSEPGPENALGVFKVG